jgi:hypothetical protein
LQSPFFNLQLTFTNYVDPLSKNHEGNTFHKCMVNWTWVVKVNEILWEQVVIPVFNPTFSWWFLLVVSLYVFG